MDYYKHWRDSRMPKYKLDGLGETALSASGQADSQSESHAKSNIPRMTLWYWYW